jgi:hypothetical protein
MCLLSFVDKQRVVVFEVDAFSSAIASPLPFDKAIHQGLINEATICDGLKQAFSIDRSQDGRVSALPMPYQ